MEMHRQGETDTFEACPICKERSSKKRRIDVRAGVWFECCPRCFSGIRTAMGHLKHRGRDKHPALGC
ncbi:MAG: hypothetical protein KOO60_10830 [Gemmatimonadales bacterium]|nr:hypothetical protein [Gemmatimonadales bacterium]